MRTMSRPAVLLWYWGPLALYAAAIFLLSSMPNPPVPSLRFAHADKTLHAIEYAGLGGLLCRSLALGGRGLSGRAAFIAAVGLAALYGASDELHQLFVPPRSADPFDWLADVTGSALGASGYHLLLRFWRRRSEPAAEGAT